LLSTHERTRISAQIAQDRSPESDVISPVNNLPVKERNKAPILWER
jgi:hypothetical protein